MENLKELIHSIKRKAENSVKKIELLETENIALRSENANLKAKLHQKQETEAAIRRENNLLRIAKSVGSKDDFKSSKQKIAELVREIDNCITLLK